MHRSIRRSVALAVALATPWALAEGIYRCGNSYGAQPCAGGSQVATDPMPSAAEAAQARRGAQADARRADELQKARLEREKNAPPAVIPAQRAPDESHGGEDGRKTKKGKDLPREPAQFTATGPRPPSKGSR